MRLTDHRYSRIKASLLKPVLVLCCLMPINTLSDGSAMFLDETNHFADPEAAMDSFGTVDESEMAAMRGGLRLGSLDIDFGVNLRTLVDGIQYETSYRMTDTGNFVPVSETITRNLLAPSGLAEQGDATTKSVEPIKLGSGSNEIPVLEAAGSKLDLPGLSESKGILFTDENGSNIVALHQITRNKILSVLISDATSHTIENDVDIDITVNNYREVRDQIKASLRKGIITRALGR